MTAVKSRELTKLKGVFGVAKWAAFVNKMPKWESQLANYEKAGISIDTKLNLCGFDPLSETPDMANALVVYFSKKRKRDDDEGNIKGVFGVAKWATFIHADNFPNWEADLKLADFNTLVTLLMRCGFDAKEAPAMANALLEYFASKKRKRDDDEGKPKPIRPILESNFLPLDQANLFVQIVDNLAAAAAKNGFVPIKLEDCEPSLDHTLFIREPYKEVWGSILKANKCRAVVSGTPGIGKSSFRYYLLWLWLRNDTSMKGFDCVTFDHAKQTFFISRPKSGKFQVYKMKAPRDWVSNQVKNCLGLMELTREDEGTQSTPFLKLAIWTASPGASDAFGKELLKMPKTGEHYLPEWSEDEVKKVFGSNSSFPKYGGIPRLLEAEQDVAEEMVDEALDLLSNVFEGMKLKEGSRLLLLLKATSKGARKVKGFISPYVAKLVYEKYKDKIRQQSGSLAKTLENAGFLKSAVGMFFEPAFHHSLLDAKELKFDKYTVPINSHKHYSSSKIVVALNALCIPTSRVNDTFDSYMLFKDHSTGSVTLVFIQVTVGSSHSPGRFDQAVRAVYDAVKVKHGKPVVVMLYAIPKGATKKFHFEEMKNTLIKIPIVYSVVEALFSSLLTQAESEMYLTQLYRAGPQATLSE